MALATTNFDKLCKSSLLNLNLIAVETSQAKSTNFSQ